MSIIKDLPRATLEKMVENFAKNWLAHDGLWFQAVEGAHGMEEAIRLDTEAWRRFSPIEAKRIKELLGLPEFAGLQGLEQAFDYRLYAVINKQSSKMVDGKLQFFMNDCRVQSARKRRGLPDFPCKSVGLVEYETFAKTIDPRIQMRCITCPPDAHPEDYYCGWEFWIEEED